MKQYQKLNLYLSQRWKSDLNQKTESEIQSETENLI